MVGYQLTLNLLNQNVVVVITVAVGVVVINTVVVVVVVIVVDCSCCNYIFIQNHNHLIMFYIVPHIIQQVLKKIYGCYFFKYIDIFS